PWKVGVCSICASPDRHKVDVGLVHKVPFRILAKRYGMSEDSISRHARNHLTPAQRAAIATAVRPTDIDLEALQRSEAEGILCQLVAMRARLAIACETAAEVGNIGDQVKVERAILDNLELTGRLLNQFEVRHTVTHTSVLISADYIRLRQRLVE